MPQDTQNRRVRDDRRECGTSPGRKRYGRNGPSRGRLAGTYGGRARRLDGDASEAGIIGGTDTVAAAYAVAAAIVGVAILKGAQLWVF
jgi:hypothetical protein